jgi:CDP-diacylglycerol--serine O-phosphatidyltransferase
MNNEPSQEARVENTLVTTEDAYSETGSYRGSILGHAADFANATTLAGLFCALLGIHFAAQGVYSAAMIGLLWAIFFDWFDGPIARRTNGRTDELRALGGQLDSLVDIISSGVAPAILLLSIGEYSPWFIPGAFALVAAGVLRLSYFNVFGLENESTYLGLPIDHNVIVLALVFLLEGQIEQPTFAIILYAAIVLLAVLNVTPFRMPKVGGLWYWAFTVFVTSLTAVYGWRLWADIP